MSLLPSLSKLRQRSFHHRGAICLLLFGAGTLSLSADVQLAPLFSDGAVLQQGKPVPVWGSADPGERIEVQFGGQKKETTAGQDGKWRVELDAMPASRVAAELTVKGGNTLKIGDILVGEIWICSGQSNMEWPVTRANDAANEVAAANYPMIRHFKIPHTVADAPADSLQGGWSVCRSDSVVEFSAVGYYFGRELHRKLDVPIGLINSSWGGTQIESWMSEKALKSNAAFAPVFESWQKRLKDFPAAMEKYTQARARWSDAARKAKEEGASFTRRPPREPEGPGSRWLPAGLYNAMIHPLVPYALRGVIWYQGEANGPRAAAYEPLFQRMIQQWRSDFAQGDFPFYFVQLANCVRKVDPTDQQWAFLRDAQTRALALPETGMAVTVDIGDPNDIHPSNKQEVGRRLALNAFAKTYGMGGEYSGPMFKTAKRDGAVLRISFTHSEGLSLREPVGGAFEVAGADKVFRPAIAAIKGSDVLVSSPEVAEPVAARYAWKNAPASPLYNGAGLPASPFRTDDWPSPAAQGLDATGGLGN